MAIGTAAAILGSAVIGAGASAINSNKAVNSAKDTSQYATDQTIAFNNKALDTQQANTQPYRDAGALGTQALLEALGLSKPQSQGQGQAQSPQAAETAQLQAYLANNPDVAQSWSTTAYKNPKYGGDITQWAKDHYDTWGKAEGRTLPSTAKPQDQAPVSPLEPTAPGAPAGNAPATDPKRPDLVETTGYQGPSYVATPGYKAPEIDPLNVGLDKYQVAPGYEWQQNEASRATLAGSAATGALRSGAAAKALQDRAQNIANLDYTNWRDYTTGQYNTDRNYTAQQAQFAYNAMMGQNQAQNAFNLDNSQFGYNALTAQNNSKNQYNQQNFNTDRAFSADQKQQNVNNLFGLAGMGASAAGAANSAIGANASNNANALFSNASAQGNAALAGAGQINNAINTGTNAFAYYLGNKTSTPVKTGGVYGPVA